VNNDRMFGAVFVARQHVTEAHIQRAICDLLRMTGWVVVETSQHQKAEFGLVGMTDVCAWKRIGDVTVCWLIEVKSEKGKLRRSQILFADRIREHLSATLWYTVARDVDEIVARMETEI
jgi:hypothetical protein